MWQKNLNLSQFLVDSTPLLLLKIVAMKNTYLVLAIIGFIAPNIFAIDVMLNTGNVLLWSDLPTTLSQAFINKISTTFVVDLLATTLIFFIWSYNESRKCRVKNQKLGIVWVLTMLFGLSTALPLFLYFREGRIDK